MHKTKKSDRRGFLKNAAAGAAGLAAAGPIAMAQHGQHAGGAISNPNNLAPAIGRALEQVKKGRPALLDVVTQRRYQPR